MAPAIWNLLVICHLKFVISKGIPFARKSTRYVY